jgi:pilus assembly protein CpaD
MAHRLPLACAVLALAVSSAATAAPRPTSPDHNRGLESEHQPVVSRTDFSIDVVVGPSGLATGEPQRLAGWLDGLALGYGDTVTLADPGGWRGDPAADGVGMVLSRYGMLLSGNGAPVEAGRPPAGSVRVVVSRAVARVDGCPDWSRGNYPGTDNATTSNFGCATAQNLAAMIANPQDLVEGARAAPGNDAVVSIKAIQAWREADSTGKGGLTKTSTKSGGN